MVWLKVAGGSVAAEAVKTLQDILSAGLFAGSGASDQAEAYALIDAATKINIMKHLAEHGYGFLKKIINASKLFLLSFKHH